MAPLALFGTFGFQEMLLVLLILVLLFGARRIPELARGLGEGIRGFRTSLRGDDENAESKTGGVPKDS
jgi:sec-independent protein translocase protein TatA